MKSACNSLPSQTEALRVDAVTYAMRGSNNECGCLQEYRSFCIQSTLPLFARTVICANKLTHSLTCTPHAHSHAPTHLHSHSHPHPHPHPHPHTHTHTHTPTPTPTHPHPHPHTHTNTRCYYQHTYQGVRGSARVRGQLSRQEGVQASEGGASAQCPWGSGSVGSTASHQARARLHLAV